MVETPKGLVQKKSPSGCATNSDKAEIVTANKNYLTENIRDLQVESMETQDKVSVVFKYLKLKIKLKKTLSKIWFNKQCMFKGITPKYAKVKINNNSDVAKKVKAISERLWVRLEIRHLYGKLNRYNRELVYKHLELYKMFSFIELEQILYEFGDRYINGKLESKNKKLQLKLEKLLKDKEKTDNKRKKIGNYAERVVNFSDVNFTLEEQELLEKGLKYAPPSSINREEMIVECEKITEKIADEEHKKQIRHEVSDIIEKAYKISQYKKKKSEEQIKRNLNKLKRKIQENQLIVTKADKGNTTVIMCKHDYIKRTEEFIKEGPYKEIKYDYTSRYQAQIKKALKGITFINESKKKVLTESNPEAPRFKCQLKLHKENKPLRPIVSFINSPSYRTAKEVSKLLKKLYEIDIAYNIENSKEVIEKLKTVEIKDETKLISLDVKDMFTNIPADKVIHLVKNNRLSEFENKEEVIELLSVCLRQNYFRFNNRFYVQEEGLPMGSPLSPVMADIYMNEFEKRIITESKHRDKIKTWLRYVDDILLIWEGNDEEFEEFVNEINGMEQKINFQEEVGGKEINYLDLHITINNGMFKFDIFRKKTYSDLIIPNESYHPISHKMAALNSFCNRAVQYLKENESKNIEIKRIKQIAKNNNYNPRLIDKIVKRIEGEEKRTKEEKEKKYAGSVTYMGWQTKKILKCFEKYDVHVAIKKTKTVFDHIKNNNTEDIPVLHKSGVYKLKCNECSKVYVGETGRRFEQRLTEHARGEGVRTTNSLYARHFLETGHQFINPIENVEILKIEGNQKRRKLFEELAILKEKKENVDSLMNIKTAFDNEQIFYRILQQE